MSPTLYPTHEAPQVPPEITGGLVPSGMRSLAQTLPVLKVPNLKYEDDDDDLGGDLYVEGPDLALEDLTTMASNAACTFLNGLCIDIGSMNDTDSGNSTDNCTSGDSFEAPEKNYWTLLLLLFPVFTVFGNILVLMSVYKERSLQTVTNYFIVSLAVADLLVASLVMPFAVYYLWSSYWELGAIVCDLYISTDVVCSTSSIFNLVAISIDRYIAVTHAPVSPFLSCKQATMTDEQTVAQQVEMRKKRTFRKFTYRGVDLDQLLDMSNEQLVELFPCRQRRRFNRGLKRKHMALLKRLRKAKKECPALEKPAVVKTHLRDMVIIPEMVGSMIGVYNGKTFNQVEIKPEMISHYLAEFSITYKPVKHGRPGIGATHSSRFIPLK